MFIIIIIIITRQIVGATQRAPQRDAEFFGQGGVPMGMVVEPCAVHIGVVVIQKILVMGVKAMSLPRLGRRLRCKEE